MKTAKHYRLMDDLDFFNLELRKAKVEVEIYQQLANDESKSNHQKGQYKRWLAHWENEVKGNENCIKRIQEEIAIEVELYEAQQEVDNLEEQEELSLEEQLHQLVVNIVEEGENSLGYQSLIIKAKDVVNSLTEETLEELKQLYHHFRG